MTQAENDADGETGDRMADGMPRYSQKRVTLHLIEPLLHDGLKRHPRQKAEDLAAGLAKVKKKLRYMSAENLDHLADIVRQHAGGASKDIWPSVATILNLGEALEPPPREMAEALVRSYLGSRGGARAYERGGVAAVLSLATFIRKTRRPPTFRREWEDVYDMADGWRRDAKRMADAVALGDADGPALSVQDEQFLQRYEAATAEVMAYVRIEHENRETAAA